MEAEVQKVLRWENRHLSARRFTLTVSVELLSDETVTTGEVREYLDRALDVGIMYTREGLGPVPGSVVIVETDTDNLRPE